LGDLGWRHRPSHLVAVFERSVNALCSCKIEPHMRLNQVLRHAFAQHVDRAAIELPYGVPLLGGQTVPFDSLGVVLRHSTALSVHLAEKSLSRGAPLLGGEPVQPDRLDIGLRHALALQTATVFKTFNACYEAIDADYAKAIKDLGADVDGTLLSDNTKNVGLTASCLRVY
jgi:hypothetical protein